MSRVRKSHAQRRQPNRDVSGASSPQRLRLSVSAVPRDRFSIVVEAANELSAEEFDVIRKLLELKTAGLTRERRMAVSKGLKRALEWLAEVPDEDPLRTLDEPMDRSHAVQSVAAAEAERSVARASLLNDCISAQEAAHLIGRSRQTVEHLRRHGKVLALRERNQWLYPRWQFDADAPGGVVPGLSEVVQRLHLSPGGAATWLGRPSPLLGGRRPIELLRRYQMEPVVRLAEEQGRMP